MTAVLGYARVSTAGQDLEGQLAALAAQSIGSGQIFTDKLSVAANFNQPALATQLHYTREGDTAIVTAIDRLGRFVAEVSRTIAELSEHRILLRALREGIDTGALTAGAAAAVIGAVAELEFELGHEHRAASLHSWRARRIPATKPAKFTIERQQELRRLAKSGEPAVHKLAEGFDISRATAYRYRAAPVNNPVLESRQR